MEFHWVNPPVGLWLMKRQIMLRCSHTSLWRVLFHSVKLKTKRNIQAEISRYHATESQHKTSSKVVHNKHNSTSSKTNCSGSPVTNQQPWLSVNLSPLCVLCRDANSIINQHHLPHCTTWNSGNIQSLVKLYWDARRWTEIPQLC